METNVRDEDSHTFLYGENFLCFRFSTVLVHVIYHVLKLQSPVWWFNSRFRHDNPMKIITHLITICCFHSKTKTNVESSGLKMLYAYTLSQRFNTIRILVLRDITKIFKKIKLIKQVKNIFCIIIIPKSYWQIIFKKLSYKLSGDLSFFFILNEFIVFLEFFQFSFTFLKFFWEFWKMNVTLLILDMFFIETPYCTQKFFEW